MPPIRLLIRPLLRSHPQPLRLSCFHHIPSPLRLISSKPQPPPQPSHTYHNHNTPQLHTQHRLSSTTTTSNPKPKSYDFPTLSALSSSPSPSRLIIDVREPSELQSTGRIPGAVNMPITSNPDALFLGEEEFRERFGFERPRARATGDGRGNGGVGVDGGATEKGKIGKSPYSGEMKAREARSGLNKEDGEGQGDELVGDKGDVRGEEGKGEGVEEVIFYCKAGIRSRAAARLAREWTGVRVGTYDEGWDGWEGKGGKVER